MLKNYFKDPFGVIHQRNVEEFSKDYAAQYNDYGELSNYMGYLRYGYMQGVCKEPFFKINSVLDIGYGNGAFLKVCQQAGIESYGYDIGECGVPSGCIRLDNLPTEDNTKDYFDVITMFDSLEHFDDLTFVYDLPTKFLVISVPNCRAGNNDEWFENWKHRRPNEHLHHFNYNSLPNLLTYQDQYKLISSSYVEDVIRKGPEPKNILTMVFKKCH